MSIAMDAGASREVFESGENARRFGYRHAERRGRADARARRDYSARQIALAKVQITRAADEQRDIECAIESFERWGEEFLDVDVRWIASYYRQRGQGFGQSHLKFESKIATSFVSKSYWEY